MALLGADDPDPVGAADLGARSPFLLVCDHAGRAVPRRLGHLGLPEAAFETHIAIDLGAAALTERLGAALAATVIRQEYSRLVIDCNRAPGHAQSIAETSDGVVIPGNRALATAARQERREAIHAPYHACIAKELDARRTRGLETVLVCVHSFTPVMDAFARPWHVGVLHGGASPISDTLLTLLRDENGLVVGDNQPYAMDGTDYTAPHHGWGRGLDVVELEVRQDLLAASGGLETMASLFTRLLPAALGRTRR